MHRGGASPRLTTGTTGLLCLFDIEEEEEEEEEGDCRGLLGLWLNPPPSISPLQF